MTTVQASRQPPARGDVGHGDTYTHSMLTTAPSGIVENDIFKVGRTFRTVAQVLRYRITGEIVVYFCQPHEGGRFRVKFPEDAPDVTVYRPNAVTGEQ